MTIYTRLGGEVTIELNYGQHQAPYLKTPCTLVVVMFHTDDEDDGKEKYYWAEFLKAPGGWAEIDPAVQAADKDTIPEFQLGVALEEAQ